VFNSIIPSAAESQFRSSSRSDAERVTFDRLPTDKAADRRRTKAAEGSWTLDGTRHDKMRAT
jgi:hypothetical protein